MPHKKGTRPPRVKNWIFTDYKLLDFADIFEKQSEYIRGIAWGDEICPTTQRKHKQGFVQFSSSKARTQAKKILGSKEISLRIMDGSIEDNEIYCSKDEKYIKLGVFKRQGQRTDVEFNKKTLDDGAPLSEIWDQDFTGMLRNHRGYAAYKKVVDKRVTKKFRVSSIKLICGPTGTNKTRRAVENSPSYFKISAHNLKWFDGYEMEDTLIIDEYNNNINITELLALTDGYQLRLELKGSHTYANWTKVIITTNLHPDEIHAQAKPEHRNALFRRITQVIDLYEDPGYESEEVSDG